MIYGHNKLKDQLLHMQKELKLRAAKINQDITHVEGPVSLNPEEQAVQNENAEVLDALAGIENQELADVQAALKKMEKKSYGLCEQCGHSIEAKRLSALPQVRFCFKCSQNKENLC